MPTLHDRDLVATILANGRVESDELTALRELIYAGGGVDRDKADLLAELFKRVQRRNPAFEDFFYTAIKDHILADGAVTAEETQWLRQLFEHDGGLADRERKFLHELKGESTKVSPEFEAFFAKCMKQPPEQRTSGG